MNIRSTRTSALLGLLLGLAVATHAADVPAGQAKGTCANKGDKAIALSHAIAFIDQKDDRKPTVLILSDVKVPAEKWTSEFDLMRASSKNPFSGAVFFLKDGEVYRSDFYWKGQQSGVSGYFTLKLDGKTGKDLTGSVASTQGDATQPKVDASFHAILP